ncbi:MAG: hypothetical protein RI885_1622 [Actinomycetota bacterium]|jgi:uncharacterized Tic20 family protein
MSEMPPQSPYQQPPQPMSPADEKLWATLIHIGGIFFSFVPALIGYLALKDRGPFVRGHATTALNFHLTLLILYIAGTVLSWLIFPILLLMVAPVLGLVFGIIAAVAANRGEVYFYPLTIRFVQ